MAFLSNFWVIVDGCGQLWVVFLGSCGWLWVVAGGYGWFWMVVCGCRWLWVVAYISLPIFQQSYKFDIYNKTIIMS